MERSVSPVPFKAIDSTASDTKPNILFVLSDDLSYPLLHCYRRDEMNTPNLDRMAAVEAGASSQDDYRLRLPAFAAARKDQDKAPGTIEKRQVVFASVQVWNMNCIDGQAED